MAQYNPSSAPHIPVLLSPILEAIQPVRGKWVDGTFGAGGYTRALLDAGASKVFALDQDPEVFKRAEAWKDAYPNLQLIHGRFGNMQELLGDNCPVDGVVLDIGVSSMQIDQPERGFSFLHDGPLDMRMSQDGPTAAAIVNHATEKDIADLLFLLGEERASRRIAKAIVKARSTETIETTAALAEVISSVMPHPKPGQIHPATRSFQALRIAVNDELGQLVQGLQAAEAILGENGILAVVSFHSLEDRIVKRFMQLRSGGMPRASRYAPQEEQDEPRFELMSRKAIGPSDEELEHNPRARSAKLRLAKRLSAPAGPVDLARLGIPKFDLERVN